MQVLFENFSRKFLFVPKMVSTYVTKTTKNERAYVKPPRKCSKCKRREIQRNSDKCNCLSKRSLSVTADVEATIRQTLLAAGWTQEPIFDDYVEEYLW